MFTLAIGRTLNMIIDGLPTDGYIFGIMTEYFLGFISIYQLKNIIWNKQNRAKSQQVTMHKKHRAS